MSYDIRVGLTKTYKMKLSITGEKQFLNKASTYLGETNDYEVVSDKYIEKKYGDVIFSDNITAQLTPKATVIDKSVPNQEALYYLVKNGATYQYVKEKPFNYYTKNTYKTMQDVETSYVLKSNRGLIHSKGTDDSSWLQYSFPYGGITKSTLILGYSKDNVIYDLDLGDSVRIDFLEGIVYIKQDYPDRIDYLLGYFDIEPLEINSTDYLKIEGKSEELFCTPKQKNTFGDITVETISPTSYVIMFSYNTFITPSDPYFISVDGINLLSPRHILKNTPILVEQNFNVETDSFTEYSSQLYHGVESVETELLTSVIKFDSKDNYELFNKDKTSAGLFLYREIEEGVYDSTKPAYLPLFSPQQIIKEY